MQTIEGFASAMPLMWPGQDGWCRDKGDCVFYLQKGRAKLTVISKVGKEAMIALFGAGDFLGEESVAAVAGPAISHGDGYDSLYCAQDRAERDDSRDPRAACVF